MPKAVMILLVLLLLLLPGAASAETRVMVVSDLHYLAPALYQGSEIFLLLLQNGDGKATQYGEDLLSGLYQEILAQRPDALIATGDLTFNGEKESHQALAAWFGAVEEAGVPVWVIPGNHDINIPSPVRFTKYSYEPTEPVTPEQFAEIYRDFLLPGTVGFSYAAPISDELTAVMMDVAWYQEQAQTFGVFTPEHAAWLEETLRQAGDTAVITATHHSLLSHTDFSRESYLMFGHEAMAALNRRCGVKLNLSGHLHIQHIVREDGLTDAALGAFCMWPHRYALVTLRDGALTYEAKALNPDFLPPGTAERTRAWFFDLAKKKISASGLTGTEAEIDAMAAYAARFNQAYFTGEFRGEDETWRQDPAYALWEKQPNSSFFQYMKLVMREAAGDHLRETL